MAGIPFNFRSGSSNAIASYDWYDWGSGTAYKRFYPCGLYDSVGAKYILTDAILDASYGNRAIIANAGTVEADFDLIFKNPAYLTGTALLQYTIIATAGTSLIPTITVYHVNLSATETSIGTVTGVTEAGGGGGTTYRRTLSIALTSKKFSPGEKLRITISCVAGGAGNTSFYIDPGSIANPTESTTGATITTDCILDLPFKIDL